jgi:hypothetical protein
MQNNAAFLPSASDQQAMRRFTWRFVSLLACKHALWLGACWCFVWGTGSLILRAVAGTPQTRLWWGALGLPLAALVAFIVAWRQRPQEAAVRALLDQRGACGGLLMSAGETALGAWTLPPVAAPRLRWQKGQASALFAAALGFVLAAILLPARAVGGHTARPLDVQRETEQLQAEIEALKEAQLLEQAKADALEQQLKQLAEQASGSDPVKTWEALDHLSSSLEKSAKEAAESAAQKDQKLDQAEALTEGLQSGANELDEKTLTEAMQTLSGMMKQALEENAQLAQSLSPALQEAIKNGSLKPEQLKDIANALKQNRAALNQQLDKLAQSGLIDPQSLKGGATAKGRDNTGLAKFLKENAQKVPLDEAVEQWCAGKGGVDRGRGDAALTWTDGSKEDGAQFKEKTLPPSGSAAPDAKASAAAHGALNNASAGGGSAYTLTVLPRHKGAVKRYFEKK